VVHQQTTSTRDSKDEGHRSNMHHTQTKLAEHLNQHKKPHTAEQIADIQPWVQRHLVDSQPGCCKQRCQVSDKCLTRIGLKGLSHEHCCRMPPTANAITSFSLSAGSLPVKSQPTQQNSSSSKGGRGVHKLITTTTFDFPD
jgi:hypothetical protein